MSRFKILLSRSSKILAILLLLALNKSAKVFAQVNINAGYSSSADLFSLMDNTSGWLPFLSTG